MSALRTFNRFLPIFLTVFLLPLKGEDITVHIHYGNGITSPSAMIQYDTVSVIDIHEFPPPSARIPQRLAHMSPLMADLNIYRGVPDGRTDSLMLSRGIAYYLHRTDEKVWARKIGKVTSDTLAAWFLDLTVEDNSSFVRIFSAFDDNIRAFRAFDQFPDSLALPSPGTVPLQILRQATTGTIYLWLQVNDPFRARLAADLLQDMPFRLIIESPPQIRNLKLFGQNISLIDLKDADNYLRGDLKDAGNQFITDFNDDFLIRMPAFGSFWESLQYFSGETERNYTDEQILSLYTVMAYPFFSNFFNTTLIVADEPAQFVLFSTDPFSTRSLVLEVVDNGSRIYGP